MRYDLRWKWTLGLRLNDHGCDHSSLCVFRARLLARPEEGRLFPEIVSRGSQGWAADQALGAGDGQLADAGGGGGAGHAYKLIRTALLIAELSTLRLEPGSRMAQLDWGPLVTGETARRLADDASITLSPASGVPAKPASWGG